MSVFLKIFTHPITLFHYHRDGSVATSILIFDFTKNCRYNQRQKYCHFLNVVSIFVFPLLIKS